jgi:putative pyruvate formate lyase activating enzyme
MHRQVGPLKFDEKGVARRGVLVRHLVMPGMLEESRQILHFLAEEVSSDTYVNVMAQYRPAHKVTSEKYAEINRPLTTAEYKEAVEIADEARLRLDERRPFMLWRL